MLPGLGTKDDIKVGAEQRRIDLPACATTAPRPTVSDPALRVGRELGLETVGS